MINQIPISVANVNQLLGLGFNHIEVWKSEDDGNSYGLLMQSSAGPPVLESLLMFNTLKLTGAILVLDFSGVTVSFLFDAPFTNWTPQQAADRMNQVRPGCASAFGGTVYVTGTGSGRGQYVRVLSSPPAFFATGAEARGIDAYIPLVTDRVLYVYQDLAPGFLTDRYRWRYSAQGLAPFSDFSAYAKSLPPARDPSKVSLGYANFVDLSGAPTKGRLLIVEDSAPMPNQVTLFGGPRFVDADAQGFLQVRLLRGAKIRVAIEGTSIVRAITVPDAETFDIMAVVSEAPDAFTPATTEPLLTRRSI
jgi:hypothetical protein